MAPPRVVVHLNKLLENERAHWQEVAQIIETEPAVAARILKLVNSPFYGLQVPISSIQQALVFLGSIAVTSIAVAVGIFTRMMLKSQPEAAEQLQRFWWHSACTALVAKALARQIEVSMAEQVFTAGLLHDIGKLIVIQASLLHFRELERRIQAGEAEHAAERALLGATHEEIGDVLAQRWYFPESIRAVVRYHSAPHEAPRFQTQASIVRIADLLCELWGAGIGEGIQRLLLSEEPAWRILEEKFPDLSNMDIAAFTLNMEEHFHDAATMLQTLVSEV
ncbi:MAG: HDOD domain-containing protein [Bacteroidota bacterium]|nr:HDOD domain-containing protein [Bacteroidota bacterium]